MLTRAMPTLPLGPSVLVFSVYVIICYLAPLGQAC